MENPKIRFKGFTKDWEQRKLGDVCSRVQGNDGRMKLPTLTISAGNGWMRQEDRFSGNIAGNEQKNYTLLHTGELSYNHGNSKLAKYGAVFSLRNYEEALVPRVYHSFRVEEGCADYIEYYFATKLPDRELRKLISSGARMDGLLNIGYDEFMGIKMMFPSIKEQNEIATYFRSLDHLITLHQRKCEQTKKLKKYMLQKMFPQNGAKVPEIRFYGFTYDWEQRKLGDMGSTYTGLSGKTKEDFGHGDAKFITYMNVFSNPVANLDMTESVEIDSKQNCVKAGDVFFTTSSETPEEVGMSSVMPENADNIYLNSFCFGYRPTEKFDLNYLAYVLRTESFRKEMTFLAQGISRYNISKNKVMEVEIPIPSLDEQSRVGQYFKNLDTLITLHQRKCDELKKMKKYMLQNMFI